MSHSRGFTLVELLVAMVIIAVLGSLTVAGIQHVQRQALASSCISNLNALGAGLNNYLADHNMQMPNVAIAKRDAEDEVRTIDDALARYVDDPRVFRCPADREGIYEETGSSYFWNSLLSGQSALNLQFFLTDNEVGIPVLSDKENFHHGVGDGVNVLYADGHVARKLRFR